MRNLLLVALATFLLASPLRAQEGGWTPELAMEYRAVTETAVSPSGDLVAYVVRTPLMEGEQSEYRSQIHVAAADGSFDLQFTHGEHSATDPVFSPDGTKLAFLTDRSGEPQVWVMHVRGGEAQQLTDAETGVGSFQWSPAGDRIAFTSTDEESKEIREAKKEKRDAYVVDENFRYTHLYTIPADLKADSLAAQRLTGGEFTVTGFDWSPDGRTIAFSHAPDPRINTNMLDQDLSTVPADSGAVAPLVRQPGVDTSPRWSPDGSRIAFVSDGGRPERVGLGDVYVVPASGGAPVKLAPTPDRNPSLVDWSPDGRAVLATESLGTTRQLLAVPVPEAPPGDAALLPDLGEAPVSLTPFDGVVGAVSISRDGRLAFALEDTDRPADVYTAPVAAFEDRSRLTDLHADVEMPPLGRTELIRWESDGLEIEGLLTYPVGYEDGERVPLVLQIHGGPAGVFSQGFTGGPGIYMTQVFAQNGYAVLRPNPRGSTGYGKDFRYANVQDWGYGDYRDLMTGVDRVLEMGVAHPDSLVVMGWSYGGYMTSWVVTQTDRFKAASMGAGLPNLISMVTTTDVPDYLVAHMDGEFWDDYEAYERHSAIYHIANVKTPTQVIHGANDLRVPFAQGQEFYVALQRLGVPTEMVVLPRTPHGPREPKLLMSVTPFILDWFDDHLGR